MPMPWRNQTALVLRNAWRVCLGYFAFAAAVDAVLHVWRPKALVRMAHSFDALPVRVLTELGLFEPLRERYWQGGVSLFEARLAMGAVVGVTVLCLSVVAGLATLGLRKRLG